MPSAFLHGVETVDVTVGSRPVREIRSAVIGIIGTAPDGPVNTLTVCLNSTDDAVFGSETAIHTLPAALRALRECGAGAVMVVNVGNMADGSLGTDQVAISDIVGDVTADGLRTGIQLLDEGYGTFGFDARILIAPGFSSHPAVAAALEQSATRLHAIAYVDMPLGLTPMEAIAARGNTQPLGLTIYQTQSSRMRLHYPHVKAFSPVTDSLHLEPLSIRSAGTRARIDREIGWWTSSSNKPLTGVMGLERTLTARIDDPETDVQYLNAAGITTVFRDFGTAHLLWGNRTAMYPTDTAWENFEQVQRSKDMIETALHYASLPFVDQDIDQGGIDHIVEMGNNYLNLLFGRNAIVGGEAFYNPARNPASQISEGQIRVGYKFTPKFPMERIAWDREVTGEYLINLKAVNMGV